MTLEEAKELFFSSNCSKFNMGQEYPLEYQMYSNLNIRKEVENEWRYEQLEKYWEDIKLKEDKKWIIFNRMYDLVESLKNEKSIEIMKYTTKYLLTKLEQKERVIVAETIVGRKDRICRSGLIYITFDMGETAKAKTFANYALDLLNITIYDDDLQKRIDITRKTCIEIKNELSIN